jgi:hypothetical protein
MKIKSNKYKSSKKAALHLIKFLIMQLLWTIQDNLSKKRIQASRSSWNSNQMVLQIKEEAGTLSTRKENNSYCLVIWHYQIIKTAIKTRIWKIRWFYLLQWCYMHIEFSEKYGLEKYFMCRLSFKLHMVKIVKAKFTEQF